MKEKYRIIQNAQPQKSSRRLIIFDTVYQRNKFFENSHEKLFGWLFNNRYREYHKQEILVDTAAAPKEYIWQHFSITTSQNRKQISKTWVACLVVLAISFWLNRFLTELMVSIIYIK